MNPALVIQLLRTPPSRALISKGIENVKPYLLDDDPPDSTWQDRLDKEKEEAINEDPEKERGRGDKGRVNELENADNGQLKDSNIKEISSDDKNKIKEILNEGQKNKAEIIKEEGTKSFQERIIEERGWSPDDGANLEIHEPKENIGFDINENQFALSDTQKEAFIELAQLDNLDDSRNRIPIEQDVTFEGDFESVDMDISDGDGGDGGDGGE